MKTLISLLLLLACTLTGAGQSVSEFKTAKPRRTQSFAKVKAGVGVVTQFRPTGPGLECFVCNIPLGTNAWKVVQMRTDVPVTYAGALVESGPYHWPSYVGACRTVGAAVQFLLVRMD